MRIFKIKLLTAPAENVKKGSNIIPNLVSGY